VRTPRPADGVEDGRVWLEPSVLEAIVKEAGRTEPLESGGVLLGWLAADGGDARVCQAIGPGPRATHKRTRFVPDSRWQREEIRQAYFASGRRVRYLGDWHSHPGGGETPSSRDERTAKRIARHRGAQAPRPLFLILAGTEDDWQLATYRYIGKGLQRARYEVLRSGP
jgi:integrative and conjugative element protein (TIGR02256 family)